MKLRDLCPVPLSDSKLTEDVVIEEGALEALAPLARQHLGADCIVLADPETLAACSDLDLPFRKLILPSNPMADTETITQILEQLPSNHSIVAIGSGTINDLAKRASQLSRRPYIVAGTAASMNGYASGIAAILDNGLKTTVPAQPPRAIILDTTVLAKAPAKLAQAGLGDLISKPVSDTDWWLADQLGEAQYSQLPGQIVQHAMEKATANPTALKQLSTQAHGDLGAALVLSGVAMVVAGSSSPASGGEHLISHLWDMESLVLGNEKFLHGAQVGVTTCLSAAIYDLITGLESPDWQPHISISEEIRRIGRDHPQLSGTIISQALSKHARGAARLEKLRTNWSEIRVGLAARCIPKPEYFRNLLEQSGAPSSFANFNLSRQDARRTLAVAKDIRDRFTILDLATAVGLLPDGAERILKRAGF
jgi:glycerol-1-phosphate dehydrogenase [NAD(P)+]